MRPNRPSVLFYFTLMGMELSYLYLFVSLLGGPFYTLVLTLLLYPLALLSKLVLRLTVTHRMRFSIEVALVTLVILVVAGERLFGSLATGQADALGIVLRMGLCGFSWLLGHAVPHEQVNFSTIAFRFQIGIMAVLVFSQVAGSAPPVFLFFLWAPLVLFLGRWASSLSRGATVLRSPNLNQLLFAGASVMIVGIPLLLVLSPSIARTIVDWLKNITLAVLGWLDTRHEAAATPPVGEFKFDFGCTMPQEQVDLPQTGMPPIIPNGPSEISPVVIWLIVFAIFLTIMTLIALALRRRKTERKVRLAEPVHFQLQMVSLNMLRSLIAFFPWLLRKLWFWIISFLERWKQRPKFSEESLVSIRALYRNLLSWAARQGVARIPSQTPLEHLEVLEHKFPLQQEDLRLIIEVYLLARYSQKTVSQDEFDRIKRAWQRAEAFHDPFHRS